ncbi:helix-turn-helix domain-containing protein [Bacteroides faecis]|nr:helix-turn-helix domain-containing protein [Bacteroides faecis]
MSETDALSDRPKQRKSDSYLSHKSKVAPTTIRQKKQMPDLLTQSKTKLTPEVEQEILTLRGKGYSVRKIADHMKLSKSTIDRVVQKHKDSGESDADVITDA